MGRAGALHRHWRAAKFRHARDTHKRPRQEVGVAHTLPMAWRKAEKKPVPACGRGTGSVSRTSGSASASVATGVERGVGVNVGVCGCVGVWVSRREREGLLLLHHFFSFLPSFLPSSLLFFSSSFLLFFPRRLLHCNHTHHQLRSSRGEHQTRECHRPWAAFSREPGIQELDREGEEGDVVVMGGDR